MSVVHCPTCRNQIQQTLELAGQVVSCPYCQQPFQMPHMAQPLTGQLLPAQPPPAPYLAPTLPPRQQPQQHPQQQPVVLVNTASRVQPRLKSGGWFARGFSTTSGIVIALLLFLVVLPTAIGGALVWYVFGQASQAVNEFATEVKKEVDKSRKQEQEDLAAAKRFALPFLERHGLAKVADDATVMDWDGEKRFTGKALDKQGRLREFVCAFTVATFDNERKWQFVRLDIDGETVQQSTQR